MAKVAEKVAGKKPIYLVQEIFGMSKWSSEISANFRLKSSTRSLCVLFAYSILILCHKKDEYEIP